MPKNLSSMVRSDMVRLAIVDDHEKVRAGIRAILSGEPGFEIVAEASDGDDAVDLCRESRPDLVLMDVRMPKVDGLEATRAIKDRFPKTGVIILTMHDDEDYLMRAIRAGAAGYVLKDAPPEEMILAINRAVDGETTLDQRLSGRLLQRLVEASTPDTDRRNELTSSLLTPRELEVLDLLVLGKTNPQIARQLVISVGTVKNHVEHIISKLDVSDRTQAVVKALDIGLVAFPGRQLS